MIDGELAKAIEIIFELIFATNSYISTQEPWKLKNSASSDRIRKETILYITLEALRISSILLQTVMPTSISTILERIGIETQFRTFKECYFDPIARRNLKFSTNTTKLITFQKMK